VRGGGEGPRYATSLRTSVFTTQIGKLRDVADPLLIEVIHFYSDLGTLEEVFQGVNDVSQEFREPETGYGQKKVIQGRLISALTVLQERISTFGNRLRDLRAKLPRAT
jgi:hypothetical protein